MTKKFRVSNNLSSSKKNDIKSELFANQAEQKTEKIGKADKSFTVPVNNYELEMLRRYAQQEERSMRFVSRKLLREILELKLN